MTNTIKLTEALALAQAEMKNAKLDAINPHFKSKYATLASVRDTIIPALSKHGIAVTQTMVAEPGMTILRTTIYKGEEAIHSDFPIMISMENPQKVGSYLTYARRYSLAAIGCISADDDDDGNAATNGNQAKPAPAKNALAPDQAEVVKNRLISQINTAKSNDDLDAETKAVGFRRDLNDLSSEYPDLAADVVNHGKTRRAEITKILNDELVP